ncbi:MAG: diguanylate cyclase (GGDEF)-like protein/PAS domain S-box-containing protein [Psychromonas sp.]|jgi:diguanylate cyclase (GGDEF)-like protein/PAS domain S-box-containing protein|uniref:diguanylate cyclase domain-containing protein n=1 Tax=Psychromonas sp. TaxID=1884585 RepID=UPI0039E407C1
MPSKVPYQGHDTATITVSKLRQRYIIALSLIALLIIGSQIVIQFLLTAQIYDSHLVNIAGRQRMLSQKITKLSYYISTAESEDLASHYRAELKDAANLWEYSHLGLIHGNKDLQLPGNNSKKIVALFDNIQFHYQTILNAAVLISSASDKTAVRLDAHSIAQHESDFLRGMNEIVFQYDREANDKIRSAKWLEISLMITTLIVLLLEALFIFSPATKSLQRNMQGLIEREKNFQHLFAASPISILLVDPADFAVLHANKKAQDLIGEPLDTICTTTLQTYLGDNYESNNLFINKLKKGESFNEYEIVILSTQGSVVETLVSVRVITFERKKVFVIGITDISELKKAQEKLEHYASFDEMTGLLNRRTGLLFLEKAMKLLQRNGGQLSICYIDVDGLKKANDQYGHGEGDWLICTVSRALSDNIRGSDAAVRLGGDEFLLILHNCTSADANLLVAKVENSLKEIEIVKHKPFSIEFSYGITSYAPEKDVSPDELISEADNLMYQSKHLKKLNLAASNNKGLSIYSQDDDSTRASFRASSLIADN